MERPIFQQLQIIHFSVSTTKRPNFYHLLDRYIYPEIRRVENAFSENIEE